MPPFAGDSSTTMVNTREDMHNAYYADIPSTKPDAVPVPDDATAAESEESTSRKYDFVFDFNPCQSMSSALFKARSCSYCGQKCSKVRGVFPCFVCDSVSFWTLVVLSVVVVYFCHFLTLPFLDLNSFALHSASSTSAPRVQEGSSGVV
jgi:hypothetical protein